MIPRVAFLIRCLLCIGFAIVLVAGQAAGQQRAPATAEALFRAGRDAARHGDHATACEKFRESNRLDPAVGTLLNIAICEEELGQLASAWQHYLEVLEGLFVSDDRLPFVKTRVQALEKRVPRLTLRLSTRAPGTTRVRLASSELTPASFGVALPVDPGQHELVVRADGHESRHYTVGIAEGEHEEIVVEPGPPVQARPAAAPPKPKPSSAAVARAPTSGRRTAGFVIGGTGVAALAVGTVAGLMVLDRKAAVEDGCNEQKSCTPEALDAADSGTTLGAVSNVAFVAGILAVLSGAYLVLSSPGPGKPQTALSCGASRSGAALSVYRSF
jgi:hypothetical protein